MPKQKTDHRTYRQVPNGNGIKYVLSLLYGFCHSFSLGLVATGLLVLITLFKALRKQSAPLQAWVVATPLGNSSRQTPTSLGIQPGQFTEYFKIKAPVELAVRKFPGAPE